MRRLVTALVAGLLIAWLTLPALAWEFEMRGESENRFRYFGRTGDVDLFVVSPLQGQHVMNRRQGNAKQGLPYQGACGTMISKIARM